MEQTISEWGPEKLTETAPIVLFVYNRLEHTRKTVESLRNNSLAPDSNLYIYSDGPKNEESRQKVKEVREFLKCIAGFKTITIIERCENIGLARNIIDGVTSIVNKHGSVIVLEDDIVTSPYFLQFMNDALNYYKDKKEVMQISGYNRPISVRGLPETYFFRVINSWGWATWKDRWQNFERDVEKLIDSFSEEDIERFNVDGTFDIWEQVIRNRDGKIYTWAVFFYASIFKRDGLVLYPAKSFVQNVGFDGTGVNCDKSDHFAVRLANSPVKYFEDNIKESALGLERNKNFFRDGFWQKTKRVLKRYFIYYKISVL